MKFKLLAHSRFDAMLVLLAFVQFGVLVYGVATCGAVSWGLSVALGTLERTPLGAAAQAVGIAQGATDYALVVEPGCYTVTVTRARSHGFVWDGHAPRKRVCR